MLEASTEVDRLPTSWHSYPKAYAVGHPLAAGIFDGPVLVEEKIDGSQFSFGRIDGRLRVRSKGVEMEVEPLQQEMFRKAVDTVLELSAAGKLVDGWTYRCEFLSKPKHNTLAYDRAPNKWIILFDVTIGLEAYATREVKEQVGRDLGLEVVPQLYHGTIASAEMLLALLDTVSILGGQKIEGMVIKNYAKFGHDKKVLMAKYVSEAFKEVHAGDWRERHPTQTDVLDLLGESLRTPARWEKAVLHLRDAGRLESSPKDIGLLFKEVQRDVLDEEREPIKEKLFEWAKGKLSRHSTLGLAEWYKERLLKSAFESNV